MNIDAGGEPGSEREQKEARWPPSRTGQEGEQGCGLDPGEAEGTEKR